MLSIPCCSIFTWYMNRFRVWKRYKAPSQSAHHNHLKCVCSHPTTCFTNTLKHILPLTLSPSLSLPPSSPPSLSLSAEIDFNDRALTCYPLTAERRTPTIKKKLTLGFSHSHMVHRGKWVLCRKKRKTKEKKKRKKKSWHDNSSPPSPTIFLSTFYF